MNKWLNVFALCALAPAILWAQNSNSSDNGLSLTTNPNTRNQPLPQNRPPRQILNQPKSFVPDSPSNRNMTLNPKVKVLRAKYKGPKKSQVANPNRNQNRPYSLHAKATETAQNGPVSLGHPFSLTPVPTLGPLIPRDAKGNPITLWAPGQKINLPTPMSRPNLP